MDKFKVAEVLTGMVAYAGNDRLAEGNTAVVGRYDAVGVHTQTSAAAPEKER